MIEELEKLRMIAMKAAEKLRKAGHDREAAELAFQTGIVTGLAMREKPAFNIRRDDQPIAREYTARTKSAEAESEDERAQ